MLAAPFASRTPPRAPSAAYLTNTRQQNDARLRKTLHTPPSNPRIIVSIKMEIYAAKYRKQFEAFGSSRPSHFHDVGVDRAVHYYPCASPQLRVRRDVNEDRLLILYQGVYDQSSILENLSGNR